MDYCFIQKATVLGIIFFFWYLTTICNKNNKFILHFIQATNKKKIKKKNYENHRYIRNLGVQAINAVSILCFAPKKKTNNKQTHLLNLLVKKNKKFKIGRHMWLFFERSIETIHTKWVKIRIATLYIVRQWVMKE